MKRITDQKLNLQNILAPVIIGAFFCFLYFYFGVGVYPDSVTYIENHIEREPLYPLILRLFRMIFGSGIYLKAVVFSQNVFAFLVTWYLYAYVVKRFRLQFFFRALILGILLVPHLFSGILTSSGIILTNAVLSEGITLTLYQLFFAFIVKMILEEEHIKRYQWLAFFTAFLTVFTRGQMMPMLLVWMVVVIANEIRRHEMKRRFWGRVAGIIGITILAFVVRSVGISCYNLVENGIYHGNTGGNMTILTNVLYSAEEEDIIGLKTVLDEEEWQLLMDIYMQMKKEAWTSADAESTLFGRIKHHEDCHDKIKFSILYPMLENRAEQGQTEQDTISLRIEMDRLAGRYTKILLPECFGNWLVTYFYVACGGLIRTVSVLQPVFSWYALFIYIVAIVLMWYLFKKRKAYEAAAVMAVVLLMIMANVFATSLTIMCLSRYMIYNMSIFYIAGAVMLQETYRGRRNKRAVSVNKESDVQ